MDWAKIAIKYLNAQVDEINVYHTAPQDKPDEFATLRLSTTLAYNRVQVTPQLIVTVWAKSRQRAAALADMVDEAMFAADENLENVFSTAQVGGYREPTPPPGYEQHVLTYQWQTNK